jgi:hypothetical protein
MSLTRWANTGSRQAHLQPAADAAARLCHCCSKVLKRVGSCRMTSLFLQQARRRLGAQSAAASGALVLFSMLATLQAGPTHCAQDHVRNIAKARKVILDLVDGIQVAWQPKHYDTVGRKCDSRAPASLGPVQQLLRPHAAPEVLQPDEEELGCDDVQAGVDQRDRCGRHAGQVAIGLVR